MFYIIDISLCLIMILGVNKFTLLSKVGDTILYILIPGINTTHSTISITAEIFSVSNVDFYCTKLNLLRSHNWNINI